ncbi:hypothetical protein SLA2020_051380 [Shorea laevis]
MSSKKNPENPAEKTLRNKIPPRRDQETEETFHSYSKRTPRKEHKIGMKPLVLCGWKRPRGCATDLISSFSQNPDLPMFPAFKPRSVLPSAPFLSSGCGWLVMISEDDRRRR